MTEMMAYCGLVCTDCPSFRATRDDDDAARARTAAYYRETYGFDLTPAQINCDGCLTNGGRLLPYCQTCQIRTCCAEKGLANCARCEDQPCEHLTALHDFSAHAKARFDTLLNKEKGV